MVMEIIYKDVGWYKKFVLYIFDLFFFFEIWEREIIDIICVLGFVYIIYISL